MSARFLCGTSGYSYEHWRDVFYPAHTRPAERLAFYATHFPAVELDVTFYRLPTREVFAGWRDKTPEDFRFALKGSRVITHFKRLAGAGNELHAFFEHASVLGEKLDVVLWQLPPSLSADTARLDAFCTLAVEATTARHAFEFRHASWFADETYAVLRSHGVGLCVANSPTGASPDTLTADFTYLRFHGGPTLPDASYSDDELAEWSRVARHRLDAGCDVYAFFNNDAHAYAPADARRLTALVGERTKV
jgi:uncharacterized protein YecE (DUF72 family)